MVSHLKTELEEVDQRTNSARLMNSALIRVTEDRENNYGFPQPNLLPHAQAKSDVIPTSQNFGDAGGP